MRDGDDFENRRGAVNRLGVAWNLESGITKFHCEIKS